MTDEQINEIVQISETIRNCYLNAIERTDADREYRVGQRNIAKWLEELKRYKEDEYVRSQKWIDVNERLPEVNKAYLVNYVHSYCENDDFSAIGISLCIDGSFVGILSAYKVTHWMPLPEPPKPQ